MRLIAQGFERAALDKTASQMSANYYSIKSPARTDRPSMHHKVESVENRYLWTEHRPSLLSQIRFPPESGKLDPIQYENRFSTGCVVHPMALIDVGFKLCLATRTCEG